MKGVYEYEHNNVCECNYCQWTQIIRDQRGELKNGYKLIAQQEPSSQLSQPQISAKAEKLLKDMLDYRFFEFRNKRTYNALCKYISELEEGF